MYLPLCRLRSMLVVLTLCLAVAGKAKADEPIAAAPPEPYQPAGAPVDPRVEARWNFYRDYAQATGLLKQIAAAHPQICRLESLGKSYDGREMWVLTITNQTTGTRDDEARKPAMWIDGGIHANELQAVDVVLYTAWYVTEMYDRSEFVRRLVDERVLYLMPMMSPDSRDAHMYEANSTHSPRTGQRPVDDDRDGLVDEDAAEDLNGDGHITQMRVRDPLGRFKPHPDRPEMLVPVEDDEVGEYNLLGLEGFDNDGDGAINEDGDGYYDPNRDWPWQWQPGYVQNGASDYPLAISENRMVAEFVLQHPHIAAAQCYHNTGGMILRGPGAPNDSWPAADVAVFDRLAKPGVRMLPGYRYLNTATGLYEVWGGETDWFYAMVGAFAFTNELNTPQNMFRGEATGGYFAGESTSREFDELLLLGDGYVKWHEVEHPQLGKVEVGGAKKNWGRQPPSFLIEEELHRNMAFTLWHADQMPQVKFEEVTVRPLGPDRWEVTATLMNRKAIPSRSSFAATRNVTVADRLSIAGEQARVHVALVSSDRQFREPRSQDRRPEQVELDSVPSWRPVFVRWIVTGSGKVQLRFESVKGGVAEHTAELVDAATN